MKTIISTGFSPVGRLSYGESFMSSFDRHWPEDVELQVYVEESTPVPRNGERSLWSCPGVGSFIKRHKGDPKKNGRSPVKGWRPKDRQRGYSFRYDAVKFCRQCFIPEQASTEADDGDIVVWLDGDVVTHRDVPDGFVAKLLGDSDITYLGRSGTHSEIGFWAVRINPRTRTFLTHLADLWRFDGVFALPEWHSAFTFDHILKLNSDQLNINNLTPNGSGHVWFQSPLAKYLDHLKGDRRKLEGRSRERAHA